MSTDTVVIQTISNEYRESYAKGVADKQAGVTIQTKFNFLHAHKGVEASFARDLYYCYSQGYRSVVK